MKFASVLEMIGRDFLKGLGWAVQYGVPVEKLAGLLFPSLAPAAVAAVGVTTLIQNAVLAVEQKFAASGVQSGTGVQKLEEVMLLTGQAVMSLLTAAGVPTDTPYVKSLISAVVAILNVQGAAIAVPSKATA